MNDTPEKYPNRFPKGVSGNPNGRPKKGNSFGEILENELQRMQIPTKDGRTISGKEAMCLSFVELAFKGRDENTKLRAMEKIMDRIDGKPKETIEGTIETDVAVKQLQREQLLQSVDKDIIDQLDDLYDTIEAQADGTEAAQ